MSTNRRQRRLEKKKVVRVRKLDWNKIKSDIKPLAIFFLLFFLFMLGVSYWNVYSNNKIRQEVSVNPVYATAKVTEIVSRSKGPDYAIFNFSINGQNYEGTTFKDYKGGIDDEICIQYLRSSPNINIYCEESTLETFIDGSLKYALASLAIMIVFLSIYVGWKVLKKDKDFTTVRKVKM